MDDASPCDAPAAAAGTEPAPTLDGAGVTRLADALLPTRYGSFVIFALRVDDTADDCVAMVCGEPGRSRAPLVRLHSECLTGDALGSLRCDCGEQLSTALSMIGSEGCGILLYLRQEGRGIGLVNKIRAYALQQRGSDTVDANLELGLPVDGREYRSAAMALRHLGVGRVRLLTNNPDKVRALRRHGVAVAERVPLPVTPNPFNAAYLDAKARRLGHLLEAPSDRGR